MTVHRKPIRWDIRGNPRLIFRPGEPARFLIHYPDEPNLDGWEFRMTAEQDPWPAAARPYHEILPRTWDWGDPVFVIVGQEVHVTIPADVMETWVDVIMEMQIDVRVGGEVWMTGDFKITIARGE